VSDAQTPAPPLLTTLDKGLRVLEALSETETSSATLTTLSRSLGIHRTTLFRILGTLRARGYVSRDRDTDRYRLGARVLTLASAVLDDLDVRQVALPALQVLNRETRELVYLTVLDHGEVITVEHLESDQPLTLRARIGARRPLHCTAAGKALVAFLPEQDVEAVLAGEFSAYTPRTITSPDVLRQQLAEVRERGFAWDDEEYIHGVRCVGAPVFDIELRAIGAVSLAAPTIRTPCERLWQLGADVHRTAREISHRLGASLERIENS
jgi:IclR family transcriptional regulator, KDG regulon repressor